MISKQTFNSLENSHYQFVTEAQPEKANVTPPNLNKLNPHTLSQMDTQSNAKDLIFVKENSFMNFNYFPANVSANSIPSIQDLNLFAEFDRNSSALFSEKEFKQSNNYIPLICSPEDDFMGSSNSKFLKDHTFGTTRVFINSMKSFHRFRE